MFFRLQQAFPDEIVLSQVAFSALLTAKDQATRAETAARLSPG